MSLSSLKALRDSYSFPLGVNGYNYGDCLGDEKYEYFFLILELF